MPIRTLLAAIVLGLLVAVPAMSHEEKAGELTISHPWSRATAPTQKAGAVFMTIHNAGTQADRLVGARSDDAELVQIHGHIRDGEMIRMRPVDGVVVPAGGSAELKPGGFHVMLIGLKGPLFEETTIPLILEFERAGEVSIEAVVESAAARSSSGGDKMNDGKMDHGAHGMKKP